MPKAKWQEEEYRRQMGDAATARQQTAHAIVRRVDSGEIKCVCGWKLERSRMPGPHHSNHPDTKCPLYMPEAP